MGYIEKNLVPGEMVLYKTRLHWIVLIWPLVAGVLLGSIGGVFVVGGYEGNVKGGSYAGMIIVGLLFLVGATFLVGFGLIRKNSTEAAVSNKAGSSIGMRVTGPDRYKLSFDSSSFTVSCSKGTAKFSGPATSKLPKLYIVAVDEWPIYVGVTKQSMRKRLRFGWKATGKSGYYGYSWRRKFAEASLDIWCHEDPPVENPLLDMETVEAEVVFLIRRAGQWPLSQTEIHFHPSKQVHRDVAGVIMGTYDLKPNRYRTAIDMD